MLPRNPSGKILKTELRKIITQEQIDENKKGIRGQLSRFLDFTDDKALLLDNAEWLTKLEYIPFLRDIGRHFSVNRMMRDAARARLESLAGASLRTSCF